MAQRTSHCSTRLQLRDYAATGWEYAEGVVSGAIPAGIWTQLACQRSLEDRDRAGTAGFPYRFDERKALKPCAFVEQLPHLKGPLAGQRITLEPWQCWSLTQMFGWVHDRGDREGLRRFRRAHIEVGRGNGKSALASGVALYMLCADGEGGAEVYSAATTRDQAKIVFDDARAMAQHPVARQLMRHCGVEVLARAVVVPAKHSKFAALSADGNTLDGLNIHLAVVDELHAHRTRDVWDVLETGAGKRAQSLILAITTAGFDRSGICYENRTYLTKILQGVAGDEAFWGCVWCLDDDDAWSDPANWIKANPNLGVSVETTYLQGLCAKAMAMPAAQNNFITKHGNRWVNADTAWMDMRAFDRCRDRSLTLSDFEGERCFVGFDGASKTDIAAKLYLFPRHVDGKLNVYCFGRYYLPEAAVREGRNSQYPGWEIAGQLTTTPGNVLDYSRVEEDLLDDCRRFQVDMIAYDPWQTTQLAQRLVAQGVNCVEYRKSVPNFSAPMKELEALVLQGRFHHDDEILAWMVSNVVCRVDNNENIFPRKERPENKIDGVDATIMALGCLLENVDQEEAPLIALI